MVTRLATELESLQKENEVFRAKNIPSGGDTMPSQGDRVEMEAHNAGAGKPLPLPPFPKKENEET